ncbi:MAG TPA: cytochrome C oxidase subunit IV family protein [Acetobacteraceae bacterium]|nr:cytochrome C oxidase subunit IV family protein [Acetobacteraceae bacterium]
MKSLASPFAIWLLLVGATLISYSSSLEGAALGPRIGGSIILVIAFFKARVIGLNFMELRRAAMPLRLVFEAWVMLAALLLLVMFGLAP